MPFRLDVFGETVFLWPFFSIDVPHAQFGGWGVWDSTNHPSTGDGARPCVIGGALSLPGGPGNGSSTPGSLNPSVPPTEPRAAFHYHFTQHDGPGRDRGQQWPTCGERYIVHTQHAQIIFNILLYMYTFTLDLPFRKLLSISETSTMIRLATIPSDVRFLLLYISGWAALCDGGWRNKHFVLTWLSLRGHHHGG